MSSGQWWETTWAKLRCADEVQAPDGAVWMISAMIDFPNARTREAAIVSAGRSAWTSRPPAQTVTARRRNLGPVDVLAAVDALRYAGFEVEPL